MFSVKRLAVFVVTCSIVFIYSCPVYSQDQNPGLQSGIAEFNQENYEEALDLFLKARSVQRGSSQPAYYLGITYKNLENYSEAKKYLKEAVKLSPVIKEALMELADVHYRLREYSEAFDVLELAEKDNVRPGQTAFMKGLVLLEMDKNHAAVESFKKAGELSPELVQAANYQIGLAHLRENELEEAELRFTDVVAKDPNTDMAVFAGNYMETISKKKKEKVPYRAYLGYHWQYDDNVLLKPSDASAGTSITDEDDYRQVVTAGFEYMPERVGNVNVSTHYSFYGSSHNDQASFDVMSHNLVVVPSYTIDSVSTADIALGYNHSWVDDQEYLSTVSVSPTYTILHVKNQTYQIYVSYQKKDFLFDASSQEEDRDADDYSINLNWYYFFQQDKGMFVPFMERFKLSSLAQNKGYFNFLYKINKEETEGRNWVNFGHTAIGTVLLNFSEKSKLSLSAEIKYQDYKNMQMDIDGLKERLDITYGFSALYFLRIHKYADLQFLYSHRRDDSNMAIYDYRRNLYSIGVELRY